MHILKQQTLDLGEKMATHTNQLKIRFEFVKNAVEKEVRNVFSVELEQVDRRKRALNKERSVRESAWLKEKTFKQEAMRLHENIRAELSSYKRQDIEKWMVSKIDEDFLEMCNGEPDKKFVNLVISKIIWDHSKKTSGLQKLYHKKWFTNPYYLEIKWKCTNCQSRNVIKFARRSIPNLEEYKCSKCGIVIKGYFDSYRFDWERQVSAKELQMKALKLKEFISNHSWPSEKSSNSVDEWNSQAQYIVFQRYKNKLSNSVQGFLDYFHQMPKSKNYQKDFQLALEECKTDLSQLEEYGLIKTTLHPTPFPELAQQIVEGLHFRYNYKTENSMGSEWICPFSKALDPKKLYFIEEYFVFFGTFSPNFEDITLNQYYFNPNPVVTNFNRRDVIVDYSMEAKEATLTNHTEIEEQERSKQFELLLSKYDHLCTLNEPQKRGFLLQDIINRLFSLLELPVFKPFKRNGGAEQIDGAFKMDGWYYLVECRWRKKLSDARELDGLSGQVTRAGKQTMGMFISINGWSTSVIPILKQNPEKNIILMDGYDLRCILSRTVNPKDFLAQKLAHLNLNSEPFLGVNVSCFTRNWTTKAKIVYNTQLYRRLFNEQETEAKI
jgi:hypothetical protein